MLKLFYVKIFVAKKLICVQVMLLNASLLGEFCY